MRSQRKDLSFGISITSDWSGSPRKPGVEVILIPVGPEHMVMQERIRDSLLLLIYNRNGLVDLNIK